MKRIIFVMLALVLVLSACTAAPVKPPTATEAPAVAQPTDTQVPVVVPSDTPAPAETATPVPADTEAPTEAPASSASAANTFGDITFTNRATKATITGTGGFSVQAFAYSCSNVPNDVVLTISTTNTDIYKVNYVYRLTAIDAPTISSGWSGDAKMTSTGDGNFTVDFQAPLIKSDWRTRKAWLDLQFIAFDNADVTYVSPAFVKLITYNQCP
jgi:hypothetical protein